MTQRINFRRYLKQTLAVAFLAVFAQPAVAATLYVANNGINSGTCGAKDDPCRSIGQGIANAVDGDMIVVGPGLYGDLNNNGTFGEAGEEVAEVNTGCDCMVKINKLVTVVSSSGAPATLLNVNAQPISVVQVATSGARFGKSKKGFTLNATGSFENGVKLLAGTSDIIVEGNIAIGATRGFISSGTGHVFRNNWALSGTNGFSLPTANNGVQLIGNVATGNSASGFDMTGGATTPNTATGNVAIANARGFLLGDNTEKVLSGNSAIGNRLAGVDFDDGSPTVFSGGNLFGNGTSGTNCGVANNADVGEVLTATDVFWGAANGPGADPADAVCSGAATIDTSPVATKAFKLKIKGLR